MSPSVSATIYYPVSWQVNKSRWTGTKNNVQLDGELIQWCMVKTRPLNVLNVGYLIHIPMRAAINLAYASFFSEKRILLAVIPPRPTMGLCAIYTRWHSSVDYCWCNECWICNPCSSVHVYLTASIYIDSPLRWVCRMHCTGDCTLSSTPTIPSGLWQPLTLTAQKRNHRCNACNIKTWLLSRRSVWRSLTLQRTIGTPATKTNESWT